MISHYSTVKNLPDKEITLTLEDESQGGDWKIYFLDEQRTMEERVVTVRNKTVFLTMPENSVVFMEKI